MNQGFLRVGHLPTLIAAFLYFDLSFMAWVILGPLAVQIGGDLHLDAAQKGLMVATPVLAGAAFRVVLGLLVDHLGPKRTGALAQAVVITGLALGWLVGIRTYAEVLLLGAVLGVAGASFAVALPLASRWYPPQHQGIALGIAGAGNSGTVLAALFAPSIAAAIGWNDALGLIALPLAAVLVVYLVLAKDSPEQPAARSLSAYLGVLRHGDAWLFMFLYSVTFGGFVGLASSLTLYFNEQFHLPAVTAGYFTAACVFAGSLVRPVGGAVADRIGGARSLTAMYGVAAAMLALVSIDLPSGWIALPVFVVAMLALGMGNGAVFQLVPQRFRREIGVMTGLVGMAGGVGGFYLAYSLGLAKQVTGRAGPGFLLFAGLALIALVTLTVAKVRWRRTWDSALAGTARI